MTSDVLTWRDVLAGVAIVLSTASFWHQYFTRGHVVLPRPLGVALMEGLLMVDGQPAPLGWTHLWRMYLVFCNTGARHRLVYNIRLIVQQGERSVTLPIGQWVKTVKPQDDEQSLTAAGGDFAGAFAIPPRATFERVGLFKASPTAERWLDQKGVYQCALEALLDRRWRQPAWKKITDFNVVLTAEFYAAIEERRWVYPVTEAARPREKGGA